MNRTIATFATLSLAAVAAFGNPQLEVRIDNQVIPDFSTHSFADTLVGETGSVIVVLRNTGNQDLIFTETPPVMLTGAFAAQFDVIQPTLETGGKLSPNGSTAFRVDFAPQFRSANLSASLFIYTNQQAAPYRMTVRGKAVAPRMQVQIDGATQPDGGTFDFGDVEIGQTIETDLVIRNLGDGLLRLTGNPRAALIGDQDGLTIIEQPQFTVAPGASTLARIRYAPTNESTLAAVLIIPTSQNDAEVDGEFDLDLFGRGVQPVIEDDADEDQDGEDEAGQDADPNQPDDNQADPNQPADAEDDAGQDANDDAADDANDDDEFDFDAEDRDEDVLEDERNEDDRNNHADDDVNDNGDADFEDDAFEQDARVAPVGLCGFGIGFASLASMFSLGGLKSRRRR